jgi:predicted nucleic-acid-binding protein
VRAIDTNVLIRLILVDDPVQYRIATDVIATDVLVPFTVLLETGWVLSSRYGLSHDRIATTLTSLLEIPTIHMAQEPAVRWALARYKEGADFADMLHLIAAGDVTGFVTFDRRIGRAAGPDTPVPIETLPSR